MIARIVIVFVLLFPIRLLVSGQNPRLKKQIIYLIDSVPYYTLGYFDLKKIQTMEVDKFASEDLASKVIINIKKSEKLELLGRNELLELLDLPKDVLAIFFIDNDILTDTFQILIDRDFILATEVFKGSQFSYLPSSFSDFKVIHILTKSERNMEKPQKRKRTIFRRKR